MDLLSGDDFSPPEAENSLALVPVGGGQESSTSPSNQNALILFDVFSNAPNLPSPINTQGPNLGGQSNPSTPQFQEKQQNLQAPQPGIHANGAVATNLASSHFNQSLYNQTLASAWNGHIPHQQQQQQPSSPAYGALSFNSGAQFYSWSNYISSSHSCDIACASKIFYVLDTFKLLTFFVSFCIVTCA